MADAPLTIVINGVDKTAFVEYDSLTIRDVLNQPKTCTFTTRNGYQPPGTATVVIARGTFSLFAGTITTENQAYVGSVNNPNWAVSAINFNYLLRRRRPIKAYSASASTIAADLITTFTTTFTSTNVQAALASVAMTFDGSLDVAGCLSALATLIGGYWYVDESRDLHFFLTEVSSTPDALDNSNTTAFNDPPVSMSVEYSQIQTREYVKGAGSTVSTATAVGATVLPIAASAIFAGGGGKVIVGSQILTYTGAGVGYTPGTVWQPQLPAFGVGGAVWNAVIWVPALNLFVAVGNSVAMTSPDGYTWTGRTIPSGQYQSVAWSSTVPILVAPNQTNGTISTSPDGITWTTRTPAETNTWLGVVWASSLALFVVVGASGTHRVITSPDGVTWTLRTAAAAVSWNTITWSPDIPLLVAQAFATSGTTSLTMTSPDGITWTSRTSAYNLEGVCWSPTLSLFVAVGNNVIYTSPTGAIWTSRTSPTNAFWASVIWVPEFQLLFAASSTSTGSISRVATSPDGINWTDSGGTVGGSLAWSVTLGRLVAVGAISSTVQVMTMNPSTYSVLNGIPASSTGSIGTAIAAGAPVNIWVERNDAAAQTALAAIEDGGASDGIHVGYINDPSLISDAECQAAGDAALALFKNPITTVTYTTSDLKTRSGKSITVNRTHPPISSITLTIQDVTVTNLGVAQPAGPIFTVMASTVNITLQDVLTRIIETVGI